MPTIKKITLNSNGSLQLVTDTEVKIDIAPRILLDVNVSMDAPDGGATAIMALLNLSADLTDRITHQEARLAELVNFIRNVADALPKPAAPAENETQPDTATVSPAEVPTAVKPTLAELNPEQINSEPEYGAPRIIPVTSLTPA